MKHTITLTVRLTDSTEFTTITHRTSKPDLRMIHNGLKKYLGAPTGVRVSRHGYTHWSFEGGVVHVTGTCVKGIHGFRVKL